MAGTVTSRIAASGLAIFFFALTIGGTVLVIWQVKESNKQQAAIDAIQAEQEKAQQTPKEGALQGTQLENFSPTEVVDSLQKIDTVIGTGAEVKPGDTVTAHYTGAVAATGTIFQSSLDGGQPVEFSLSGVIQGWTEGVPGMRVGGKRRLIIPAAQAYGGNPPQGSGIPINAPLVFDIEMVDTKTP